MLIALTGCDGAGKSTATDLLAGWFMTRSLTVRRIHKWDLFSTERVPQARFLVGQRDLLRQCIPAMEHLARPLFIAWMLQITAQNALRHHADVHILDDYWMKTFAAEVLHGIDEDWLIKTASLLPEPDLVIYLDVDPQSALLRKSVRTPYECGRDTELSPASFVSHQTKQRAQLQRWARARAWAQVDANRSRDEVLDQIIECVQKTPGWRRLRGET
jgi:dTMP kinase